MTLQKLEEYLKAGEGIEVEFKKSRSKLNENAFESICAFLNRNGGHLFLGVADDGTVKGILPQCVEDICKNIAASSNNPQKLNPPYNLFPEIVEYEDKKIIYVRVPESSQVHSTAGKTYERNIDGDFDITGQTEQITQLYLRKQSTYTENQIYPYLKLEHFREDLFDRIRKMAHNARRMTGKGKTEHPWEEMDDEELLRSANLYLEDYKTGEKGYTLAAVLLLGKDRVIQNILPHYKTDAILRIENKDRYDDRDVIRTNLIDSYDRLMAFVQKHLPDRYYREDSQRISLRDLIFHEVISNLLVHREFSNAFPARLVIEEQNVITENWNRPHNTGQIDPENFTPHPKNPVIARFFSEIGRVEELGSGCRNIFRYCGRYTRGATPQLIEGDVFKTIIPWNLKNSERDDGINLEDLELDEDQRKIIDYVSSKGKITTREAIELTGKVKRTVNRKLSDLQEKGALERMAESETDPTAFYQFPN